MRARAYGERNVPTREKQRVDLFAQADAALALVMVRLFVDLLDQEIEVVGGRPSLLELIETRDRHRRVVALRLGELEHSRVKGQALQACRESEVGQIRMERRQRGWWWVGGVRLAGMEVMRRSPFLELRQSVMSCRMSESPTRSAISCGVPLMPEIEQSAL